MVYQATKNKGDKYFWVVTGGSILAGDSTDSVTVKWGKGSSGLITLHEKNSSSCSDTTFANVTLNALPAPTVSGVKALCIQGTEGYKVTGSAGSAFAWKVFGGKIISGAGTDSITVTWNSAGAGSVSVTETNATGCSDSLTTTVLVNNRPTPAIAGLTKVCTLSSDVYQTNKNAGSTYKWTISGGTITSGAGTEQVTVSWGASGTGNLQVVETNGSGCQDSATAIININALPTPSITGLLSACAGGYSAYKVTANTGSSYIWSVKGGTIVAGTANLDSVAVNWGTGTTGTVSVVETNSSGCSDSTSITLTLNAKPVPDFSVTRVCQGNVTSFTDASSAHTSQLWYFGDGVTATTVNATHVYDSAGTYTARLAIMNSSGCADVITKTVIVDSITNAHFTVSTNDLSHTFTALDTTRPSSSYSWSFGDGGTATGFRVTHTFKKDSLYHVKLTTVNASGCPNTLDSAMGINNGIADQIPNVFNLNLYPNPFRDYTTLEYELSRASHVKISIYALDGREIATLSDGRQETGNHQFRFTPDEYNATQGVYILRMIVNERFTTRQIIRVK